MASIPKMREGESSDLIEPLSPSLFMGKFAIEMANGFGVGEIEYFNFGLFRLEVSIPVQEAQVGMDAPVFQLGAHAGQSRRHSQVDPWRRLNDVSADC